MAVVRVWNHRTATADDGRSSIVYLEPEQWAGLRADLFAALASLDGVSVRFHGSGSDSANHLVDQVRAECFVVIAELAGAGPDAAREAVDVVVDAYPIDAAWWLVASNPDRVLHGSFPSARR